MQEKMLNICFSSEGIAAAVKLTGYFTANAADT
jgi:hypothetical protein